MSVLKEVLPWTIGIGAAICGFGFVMQAPATFYAPIAAAPTLGAIVAECWVGEGKKWREKRSAEIAERKAFELRPDADVYKALRSQGFSDLEIREAIAELKEN